MATEVRCRRESRRLAREWYRRLVAGDVEGAALSLRLSLACDRWARRYEAARQDRFDAAGLPRGLARVV